MSRKFSGSFVKRRVGYRRVRIAIGTFVATRGRMPAQQFRNGSNQVGAQHMNPRQTMLKPPLMLITCPVIQPE